MRESGAQIACRWGWGGDFCNAYTAEQRHAYRLKKAPPVLQASARVYTMVQMARAHNLNVERYLTFLLENRPTMAMSDAELERLLPWGQQAQSFCSSGFAQ